MIVIRELAEIFSIYDIDSEVLAASIRHPLHVTQAALAGSHIATLPFKVLQQMVHHPLTDKGIVTFRQDWEKARSAAAAKGATDATATGEVAATGGNGASASRAAEGSRSAGSAGGSQTGGSKGGTKSARGRRSGG